MSNKKNTSSDLQGITRLITDATIGITDLVEAMHRRVVHPPFLPSTPIQHLITKIAGFTFSSIKRSTRLIGNGVDKTLGHLNFLLGEIEATEEKEAIRAALNGVVGDYLERNENPLQIKMQFRHAGMPVSLEKEKLKKSYPAINGKIILLIHGLCMNDTQWTRKGHNHGTTLATALDQTPIYLHYNTGRHISTNGEDFSELLESLIEQWPVPVKELVIVAHSMGGLVTRSAFHYGQQQAKDWPKYLKKIIFLGTPHHGAPLEQAGNYLDVALEAVPYAKPFARLGKIRSAGITDLRYGNLVATDWQKKDRFKMEKDKSQHLPLPKGVACFSIAGIVGKETNPASSKVLGDNLVLLASALGQHKDASRDLNFQKENTWIVEENNHFDLLSNPAITDKIKQWMERF
ncbi:MAG: alpha/beta hydrolase [Saprospiraceae bacterium]